MTELTNASTLSAGRNTNSNSITKQHSHRATVTFVILTAVIIGCALPPYILYTAQNILGSSPTALTILQIIVGRTLIYALAVADPIVIMRNRDVRELFQPRVDRSAPIISLRRFSLASITMSSVN